MVSQVCNSLAETSAFGAAIARLLKGQTAVALVGTLGAGKTELARAILADLGVAPQLVSSPTFTICQEYDGVRGKVYHIDLYRVADDDELNELGPEQWLDGDGIALVEWADRFPWFLDACQWRIDMEVCGEQSREITVRGTRPTRPTRPIEEP